MNDNSVSTLIPFQTASALRAVRIGDKSMVLVQVCYDEPSLQAVDPLCHPFRNQHLTRYFENKVIADLIEAGYHKAADFFGVLSWKFSAKIPLTASDICLAVLEDRFATDVYSFFGAVEPGNIWKRSERKHPGICEAAALLFLKLGLRQDLLALDTPIVYQNHFLARTDIYEHYYSEMLAPALHLMEKSADPQLKKLLDRDSTYRHPLLTKKELRSIFGKPYITMHPFICERLFATWLALNSDLSLKHLWDGRFVEAKDLAAEPDLNNLRDEAANASQRGYR